jgi:DNA relaxase NicK
VAVDVAAPMPDLDPVVLSGWIGKAGVPETLYVGSRQYRTFWRVYDKRKEVLAKRHVDIGFSMTRYELEAKGKAARAIWPYLVDELRRGSELEKTLAGIAARFDKNNILPEQVKQADLTIFDAQYESSTWAWYVRHKDDFLNDIFNNDDHSVKFEQDCISFVQDTIMRIANERNALVRRAVYENN